MTDQIASPVTSKFEKLGFYRVLTTLRLHLIMRHWFVYDILRRYVNVFWLIE